MIRSTRPGRMALTLAVALALTACASVDRQTVAESAKPAPQWYAALPHGGSVEQLSRWWEQLSDPLLVRLLEAAQKESPSIAAAASRMAGAYAVRVQAGSGQLPNVDFNAGKQRSVSTPNFTTLPITTQQAGLQMSWELDVLGRVQAGKQAAQVRLDSAVANWHDARTLMAAEVALTYLNYRFCNALLAHSETELTSRNESARLAELTEKAGLMAPGASALVRSAAEDTANRVLAERKDCESMVKAMVALTAIDEPQLRRELDDHRKHADRLLADMSWLDRLFNIAQIPGQVLAQRPDIFMAQNDVIAAAYDVDAAKAARYPRLSLNGFVGHARSTIPGTGAMSGTNAMHVWTAGPLALSLPILDWGTRGAQVDAAKARYEEASLGYRAKVRQAVREVEDALLHLQNTADRLKSAQRSAEGYRRAFAATEARYKAGLANQSEWGDARRARAAGDRSLLAVQRERLIAWIELYRAAGGGWSPDAVLQASAPPESSKN